MQTLIHESNHDTRHLDTMSQRFECTECGKGFTTMFSKNRHEDFQHSKTDNDESDSVSNDESDSVSSKSASGSTSESEVSHSDEESEDECTKSHVDDSIFDDIINQAIDTHQGRREKLIEELVESDTSESEVKIAVNMKLRRKYEKTMRQLFTCRLLYIERVRKHPITQAIMKKVKELEEEESDMDRDEAIRTAVGYRKHLIYRLLPSLNARSSTSDDDMESDVDMESE